MNFMKKMRKFHREARAISPVIATLLMIAIAVVASLVVYAWVSGYMGFQTEKTGKSIIIQSTSIDAQSDLHLYVQNVGQGSVTVATIYLNSTLVPSASVAPALGTSASDIAESNTKEFTITGNYGQNDNIAIKVVTVDGTYMTLTRNP